MTEREYEHLLDTVQGAIDVNECSMIVACMPVQPSAANDNDVEWPLVPFPEGWQASP